MSVASCDDRLVLTYYVGTRSMNVWILTVILIVPWSQFQMSTFISVWRVKKLQKYLVQNKNENIIYFYLSYSLVEGKNGTEF